MPIKKIPDVQSIYDLSPQFRNSCVGLFKCTRGGWVELLTNTLPASLQNSPTYTPTPLGGYEMVCTTSNEHVYWTYTDLRIPEFQPFTVISFIRDVQASNNNQTVFSVCNWSGVKGWTHDSRKGTTSDTGGTKSGIVDITYTNLELANVESFFSLRVGEDKKFKGFTDEGSQLTSGTNGFKTSGTINRVVIGANWRSAASSSYARCSIGPYVLVFDKALSDDQIEQASKNPEILFNLDKIRREFITSSPSGDTNVSVNLGTLNITEQSATVNAETSITTNLATLNITEQTADVDLDKNVSVNLGTLNITEQSATVNAETSITTNLATLNITEQAADVDLDKNVSVNLGTLNITEYAATVNAETSITTNLATLNITEQTADVNLDKNVSTNLTNLNITEQNATIDTGSGDTNVNVNLATLTIGEQSATVNAETNVNSNVVALNLTEQSATVNAETNVNVNLGTLTITEQSATVNAETNVNANVVALTFSPKTAIAQLSGALGNAQIQVYSHEKSIKVYSHEKKMVVDG